MKKRMIGKRVSAALFSAAMAVTMILPGGAGTQTVAADEGEKTVAGLSTSAIKGPANEMTYDPETGYRNGWMGSYVWYGRYDGEPVKYRVLSPKTSAYGGSTMFLDCDNVLYEVKFDEDGKPNSGQTNPNEWEGSDLQHNLNGLGFLWKNNGFSVPEINAIRESYIASHPRTQDTAADGCLYSPLADFDDFTSLNGDKVFVLDIGELTPNYGYFYPGKRSRDGEAWIWWTRSAHKQLTPSYSTCIGYVPNYAYSYGSVTGLGFSSPYGVSPAFNVDRYSVIFSSVVSGKAGEDKAEYKLTLTTNTFDLAIHTDNGSSGSAIVDSNKTDVSTNLLLSGPNVDRVTQVSVLILDKKYQPGNTNNAKILHYGKMNVLGGLSTLQETGTAVFSLPKNLLVEDWGSQYYVYLLAEMVNGEHMSDYACEPILMEKPAISYLGAIPEITSQPVSTRVQVGDEALFTVTAKGTGTLKYQWQSRKDSSSTWTNSGQPGAKTATLHVTATAGLHGWQFRCLVTNNKGTTPSNPATLKVAPKITTQPKNTSAQVGNVAEFTIVATGKAPLKYQWQSRKDSSSTWTNSGQPGAKTATLHVTATAGLHNWQFRCVVTDANGQNWGSAPATLSVSPKFTTQPKSTYAAPGTEATFTVAAVGKATLKYQWQSRKNSSAEWTNSGQPGAKTATLKVTASAGLNGWQFRCVVTDGNGKSWGSAPATLYTKLSIHKQPADTTVSVGTTAEFTVEAYGKATLKYQWQSRKNSSAQWSNSGQAGAKTATLQVTTTAGLNGWQFRCLVTDGDGNPLPSKEATLTVK